MSGIITGLVIAGIGVVVGSVGAVVSADASRKAANYNADVAEANAVAIKNQNEANEKAHREQIKKILSTQRALYGRSGVTMEGSPLLVQMDTVEQGELDALAIRYGGDVAAAKERSMANLYKMQGQQASTMGAINAGTTLLSGASSAYKTYKGK